MSKTKQLLVSILKSMFDKHPDTITLDAIYQYLILDTLRADTEKHRYFKSVGQKKDAQSVKDRMLNFTPSVILSGGKAAEHIVDYTGMAMADFDHVPSDDLDRCFALLNADPYVNLAYVTISGQGLRVVYSTDVTDPLHHRDAFLQGNDHYARLLGYPFDTQCCNTARTSILCYCPQAIYHPEARCMHIELTPLQGAGADPSKRKLGRPSKRYSATLAEAEQTVLNILQAGGKTYTEGHYNEYVSGAVYLLNRYGVPQQEVEQWLPLRFADYPADKLAVIVRSVYLRTEEHGNEQLPSKKERSNYATLPEIEEFITSQARIRNNVVTEKREICLDDETVFRDITDRDENTLWARASKAGINSKPQTIQIMLNSEFVADFHPFHSYFGELAPWDGITDYIGRLADTVHTAQPQLFRDYFRKWFVGFVASLVSPLIVNHEVLVLIGAQGIYKTTWMNRLLPPEWKPYFYTKPNNTQTTKDDRLTLSQFALICFEEIDNMRPSEMNQLKAMITMPAVNDRASYARNTAHRPHVASFCGTGNNISFLNDPTGTRRWLAFEALSIDNPYEMTLPYRQIYAQALALYHSGFAYWFDQEEMEQLSRHNEAFEVPCMEHELVQMYYRLPVAGEHGVFVSSSEVMQRISALIKAPLTMTALGTSMRKLGFEPCRSHGMRGYRVMELTQEEISARRRVFDQPADQQLPF